jgi:hypothetical protein
MKPSDIKDDLDSFPIEPEARHEAFVDVFAKYLFWIRHSVLTSGRTLVESPELRMRLATVLRASFEGLAHFGPKEQLAAYEYAESRLDRFAIELLGLLGNGGFDLKLGQDHAIQFRLDAEIYNIDTGDVAARETICRGGKRFFSEYWGDWLYRFGSPDDLAKELPPDRE